MGFWEEFNLRPDVVAAGAEYVPGVGVVDTGGDQVSYAAYQRLVQAGAMGGGHLVSGESPEYKRDDGTTMSLQEIAEAGLGFYTSMGFVDEPGYRGPPVAGYTPATAATDEYGNVYNDPNPVVSRVEHREVTDPDDPRFNMTTVTYADGTTESVKTVNTVVRNDDGTYTTTFADGSTEIRTSAMRDATTIGGTTTGGSWGVAAGGAAAPAGDAGGAAATSTELRSATDIVRNVLEDYGLGELLDDPDLDLINLWVTAGGDAAGAAAVWARVRQSDPYKDRFPGMADLSAAGRAVTEATYIEMERGYIEIMNSAGIDPGFYDEPSDFGALIGGDVSVNEFNQRVALAVEATTQMTSEVREQLATYYPEVTDGDLTAYYLDPERATNIFEEREKIGAARIGGIAVETGFGSVSRQTAERLRASGVTETAARRGFQEIAPSTLAEETASERLNVDPATGRPGVVTTRMNGQVGTFAAPLGGDITREELVGGQFGTDPQAARRIEARRQRRLAAFAQRGGPAMTGGGYTGLGTAT